jgi:hypothetical protein
MHHVQLKQMNESLTLLHTAEIRACMLHRRNGLSPAPARSLPLGC